MYFPYAKFCVLLLAGFSCCVGAVWYASPCPQPFTFHASVSVRLSHIGFVQKRCMLGAGLGGAFANRDNVFKILQTRQLWRQRRNKQVVQREDVEGCEQTQTRELLPVHARHNLVIVFTRSLTSW